MITAYAGYQLQYAGESFIFVPLYPSYAGLPEAVRRDFVTRLCDYAEAHQMEGKIILSYEEDGIPTYIPQCSPVTFDLDLSLRRIVQGANVSFHIEPPRIP